MLSLALLSLATSALASPILKRDNSTSSEAAKIVIQPKGGNDTFGPLYGYMFEDINNSGDGGLYAELLQNRAFQIVDPSNQTTAYYAWSTLNGSVAVSNTTSPVSSSLPNSLVVSGLATFENEGYWGIKVDANWTYSLSFWAKTNGSSSPTVTASLESTTNSTSFGSISFSNLTSEWVEYTAEITPSMSASNTNNTLRFQVEGEDSAEVDFALFSLFPPTYKDRANGMRIDIAEAIVATKPSIWRFPGGNNLEGQIVSQRWKWNETIGPLQDRPGRLGDWAYINTDGLGLMEYLYWLEDLEVEGIMGVWAGYALEGETVNATDLQPYIQTALDQIEFVVGASNTTYGKMRADLGHEEPFNVPYIEIGNEDFFAEASYKEYRWQMFHDAIKAAYPDLKLLATTRPQTVLTPTPEYIDEHVYETPQWFHDNVALFDNRNRTELIFEGEYAVTGTNESCLYGDVSCGRLRWSTMEAATAEASFMTGLERNSDLVFAAAYAPMLENLNRRQWSPNLIAFDAGAVYLSASYYIQKIFSIYRGDHVYPFSLEETVPAGTNSSLSVVVSHSSVINETYVKLANFGNSTRYLSLDFSAFDFASNATTAMLDYVVASNGDYQAQNIPGEAILVQNQAANVSFVNGLIHWNMPAYSVGVFSVRD